MIVAISRGVIALLFTYIPVFPTGKHQHYVLYIIRAIIMLVRGVPFYDAMYMYYT